MSRITFVFRAILAGLSLFMLAACGGGGDEVRLPVTVAEASVAYDASKSFLCFYPDEGCPRVNPDTVVTWGEYFLSAPVIVTYRGTAIFEGNFSRVYYFVDHGYASTGEYILIVSNVYSYGANAHIFVNGVPLSFSGTSDFAGVDVREYSPDWLIVRTERYYLPAGCQFFMLNLRHGTQIQFSGTDEEMKQACAM